MTRQEPVASTDDAPREPPAPATVQAHDAATRDARTVCPNSRWWPCPTCGAAVRAWYGGVAERHDTHAGRLDADVPAHDHWTTVPCPGTGRVVAAALRLDLADARNRAEADLAADEVRVAASRRRALATQAALDALDAATRTPLVRPIRGPY